MRHPPPRPRHSQAGASLLEALIGVLLISVGLLATAQWQQRLREAGALARQQAEAARHGQRELEGLRALASQGIQGAAAGSEAMASASETLADLPGANARYTVERQVEPWPGPALKAVSVTVHWQDQRDAARSLRLDSLLAPPTAALALALAQPPRALSLGPVIGRHPGLPREAHGLDPTRVVFKPRADGSEAWVFDRRSGQLLSRCSGIDTALRHHQITPADLDRCEDHVAVLLAGRVRFDPTPPPGLPDPAGADGPVLPLEIEVVPATAAPPGPAICRGEAVRLVQPRDGRPARAVPLGATPASEGLGPWDELGQRHWRYHCVVSLLPATAEAPAHWAGRLRLLPQGWRLGEDAGSHRICRYSADTDGSGAIDRPAEHPAGHARVEDALIEQNFLVIDGRQACPARPAAQQAGGSLPWSSDNPVTVPHPP